MTKQDDWEKELEKLMGYDSEQWNVSYDWRPYKKMVDFIRQTREQAKQEGIEEGYFNGVQEKKKVWRTKIGYKLLPCRRRLLSELEKKERIK